MHTATVIFSVGTTHKNLLHFSTLKRATYTAARRLPPGRGELQPLDRTAIVCLSRLATICQVFSLCDPFISFDAAWESGCVTNQINVALLKLGDLVEVVDAELIKFGFQYWANTANEF